MSIMKHAMFTISTQKFLASFAFSLGHLVYSTIVLFILFPTSFLLWCQAYCEVSLDLMLLNNPINFESLYLVPLSNLRHLIFLFVLFSTYVFHTLNLTNISYLYRIKYTKPFVNNHKKFTIYIYIYIYIYH